MMGHWKIIIADLICERLATQSEAKKGDNWPVKIIDWKNKKISIKERSATNVANTYNDILNSSDQEIFGFGNKNSTFGDQELVLATNLHRRYENYDILIFQALDRNKKWLRYYDNNECEVDLGSARHVLPFEVTLKGKRIAKCGLRFNEYFGPGGQFPYDLHEVFLHDAISKGLKMKYIPYPLVTQDIKDNSGMEVPLSRFYSAGAKFCRFNGLDMVASYLSHYLRKANMNEFETGKIDEKYYFRANSFLKGACDYKSLSVPEDWQ